MKTLKNNALVGLILAVGSYLGLHQMLAAEVDTMYFQIIFMVVAMLLTAILIVAVKANEENVVAPMVATIFAAPLMLAAAVALKAGAVVTVAALVITILVYVASGINFKTDKKKVNKWSLLTTTLLVAKSVFLYVNGINIFIFI